MTINAAARTIVVALCIALLSSCGTNTQTLSTVKSTIRNTNEELRATTTTTVKPTTTSVYVLPNASYDKVLIDVPTLNQFPEYPTGCESVAAVMALKYAGETTSVANFIDNYLECSQRMYWKDGKYYAPSPYEYFLGDPRSQNSYGCMAPVIKKALIRYFGSDERVTDTAGSSLPSLCESYIDNGVPVIVWASIGMIPITDGQTWLLPDGTEYIWPKNEHCLLLVGYDANKYYFNDPYRGTVVGYTRSIVEQRYKQLGMQSLVIQ